MKLIRIGCNHNSKYTKLENLDDIFNQDQKIVFFVSSFSARKLKCPNTAPAEKFQLELITTKHPSRLPCLPKFPTHNLYKLDT